MSNEQSVLIEEQSFSYAAKKASILFPNLLWVTIL
jgi:hypothetical protein